MGKDSEKGKYTSPEGSRTWEYISAAICALSTLNVGNLVGWNSPSLAEFSEPNSRIPMTSNEASTLMACLYVGQMLSITFNIFIVDWIGRRKSILVSTVPLIANWAMIILAESVMVLTVARILAGFSMGMLINALPLYMAEIFSANIRGKMSTMSLFAYYLGVLFMFVVSPYLGVRVTAGVCTGSTIIIVICFWFIPESPYFLAMAGRLEEAESALGKLRGKTDVTEELELINATLREKGKSLVKRNKIERGDTERKQSAFRMLFTIRGNLKAFFIGMIITSVQHLCGLGAILNYCHLILKAIGSGLSVYTVSIVFSGVQVLSTVLTALTVDKFGRRPLLFGSGVIAGLFLAVLTIYFYLLEYRNMDLTQYAMIPLCSIFILVVAINIGIMPMTGLIVSELFSPDVKVLANCIVGAAGALTGILSTKCYLMAISWGLGHAVPFFGYTIVTLVGLALLAPWLPETKGKTLLEIQRELNA